MEKYINIRKAEKDDSCRIAEIIVFNNRLNFFPIFKCEEYSFKELQVSRLMKDYESDTALSETYVYDDGIIRGFVRINEKELTKLYVDSFFQSKGTGKALLDFAAKERGVNFLWALEKNERAMKFYERNGFIKTDEKIFEEGTTEYLVRMIRP